MTIKQFSYFCTWASGHPRSAARAFLSQTDEATAMLLLDAAGWRDEHVLDFERRGLAVLIESAKFRQRFWLASPTVRKILLPPAPRLAPSHVVALARAVADELLAGWEPERGVA